MREFYVYILTNQVNKVLYVGVTGDLERRIYEHKNKKVKGFTTKYNIHKLVYYECFEYIREAILREKQIKAGSRQKKIELIKKDNPNFNDISLAWFSEIAASGVPSSQ